MTEMGADTKHIESADEKEVFAKHMRNDIKLLEKRLDVAKKTIPYQEENLVNLKKELEFKIKMGELIKKYPKKLKPDYQYEEKQEFRKLAEARQELLVDNEIRTFKYKIEESERGLNEFKESYEEDLKILDFKKDELEKYMKGDDKND